MQFDTAFPDEVGHDTAFQAAFQAAFKVPCPSELDPQSPVALRVRGLEAEKFCRKDTTAVREIRFSLEKAYEVIPEGARQPLLKGGEGEPGEPTAEELGLQVQDASSAPRAFPVSPQRPELEMKKAKHPLLQRFAEEKPLVAEAESLRAAFHNLAHWLRPLLVLAAAAGLLEGHD